MKSLLFCGYVMNVGIALLVLSFAMFPNTIQAEPLTTVQSSGASENRIDIVFLGDGYTSAELGKYASDVAVLSDRFFEQAPFAQYRSYFNVHRVDVMSAESGVDDPSEGTYKNTALGGYFDCGGIDRAPCVDSTAVYDVLDRTVRWDQRDIVIVLINSQQYGGTGGSIAVLSTHPDALEVLLHEVGHSFGLLADEYDYGPPTYCDTSYEPVEPNVTIRTSRSAIKWRHWIASATAVPTTMANVGEPGLYAGAKYCEQGMYRPTFDSKMRNLYRPFEQVNTEQLVKRLYNFVSPIDQFAPAASTITSGSTVSFSVVPLVPGSHALNVAWQLDGAPVARGQSVNVDTRTLVEGDHVLSAVVSDPTVLVINDPGHVLQATRSWTIRVDNTAPIVGLSSPVSGATIGGTVALAANARDNLGVARVEFWIDGALAQTDTSAPFTFSWNTIRVPDGLHEIQARATDTSGNAARSTIHTVTVANTNATLPQGWSSTDVGAVGLSGSAAASGGTFVLRGAGADIWGTADSFRYAYKTITGDVSLIARVASLTGIHAWTKAGVMIRASTAAGSQHAFMLVSTAKGLAFQHRTSAGGLTTQAAAVGGAAPRWVRLRRVGDTFTASVSPDGVTWSLVGSQTISMPATVVAGLAITGHSTTALASGSFDDVAIVPRLPAGWSAHDIGSVGTPGTSSYAANVFTVHGSGADIWSTADEFQFAYKAMTGDGTLTAKVSTVSNTSAWTKAGLMIRETLMPGSKHASLFITPSMGIAFQRRVTTGAASAHTAGPPTAAPQWLRLRRAGTTIVALTSADGLVWTEVGREMLPLSTTIYAGLAITSHADGVLASAMFSDVIAP